MQYGYIIFNISGYLILCYIRFFRPIATYGYEPIDCFEKLDFFNENFHVKSVSRMTSTLFANCIVEDMNLVPPSK